MKSFGDYFNREVLPVFKLEHNNINNYPAWRAISGSKHFAWPDSPWVELYNPNLVVPQWVINAWPRDNSDACRVLYTSTWNQLNREQKNSLIDAATSAKYTSADYQGRTPPDPLPRTDSASILADNVMAAFIHAVNDMSRLSTWCLTTVVKCIPGTSELERVKKIQDALETVQATLDFVDKLSSPPEPEN